MARDMIARTLDDGLPCAWVLVDALYGADSKVRRRLENHRQAYVLATRSNHTLKPYAQTIRCDFLKTTVLSPPAGAKRRRSIMAGPTFAAMRLQAGKPARPQGSC
jgi:hypothetical protein